MVSQTDINSSDVALYARPVEPARAPAAPAPRSYYYALLDRMREIHEAKDSDYAGNEPYANFYEAEKLGIPAWKGAMVRLMDKYRRVVELIAKEGRGEEPAVVDEKIEDTLLDLANYGVIVIELRRRHKAGYQPAMMFESDEE
jgi:hypothetical protein